MTSKQKKKLLDKLKSYKGSILEGTMLMHTKFSPTNKPLGKEIKGSRYFLDTPREVARERKASRSLNKRPIQKRLPFWNKYYIKKKMEKDAPIYNEYDPLVKNYKDKSVKIIKSANGDMMDYLSKHPKEHGDRLLRKYREGKLSSKEISNPGIKQRLLSAARRVNAVSVLDKIST